MKLFRIKLEKGRRYEGLEMGMGQFLSFFQEDFQVEMKEKGTEKVRQVLWMATGKALSCEKNGWVPQMFFQVSIGINLSVGSTERAISRRY